jgi:hypothetical protein
MSGEMREKDAADYDLERFIEMFDTALTSDDPRVQNALRQLMMMVILTDNSHEGRERRANGRQGPLRRIVEDVQSLHRRVQAVSDEVGSLKLAQSNRMAKTALDLYQVDPYQGGNRAEGLGLAPGAQWPASPQVAMTGMEIKAESGPSIPYSNRISGHK